MYSAHSEVHQYLQGFGPGYLVTYPGLVKSLAHLTPGSISGALNRLEEEGRLRIVGKVQVNKNTRPVLQYQTTPEIAQGLRKRKAPKRGSYVRGKGLKRTSRIIAGETYSIHNLMVQEKPSTRTLEDWVDEILSAGAELVQVSNSITLIKKTNSVAGLVDRVLEALDGILQKAQAPLTNFSSVELLEELLRREKSNG